MNDASFKRHKTQCCSTSIFIFQSGGYRVVFCDLNLHLLLLLTKLSVFLYVYGLFCASAFVIILFVSFTIFSQAQAKIASIEFSAVYSVIFICIDACIIPDLSYHPNNLFCSFKKSLFTVLSTFKNKLINIKLYEMLFFYLDVPICFVLFKLLPWQITIS